jgi:hypothetical protein
MQKERLEISAALWNVVVERRTQNIAVENAVMELVKLEMLIVRGDDGTGTMPMILEDGSGYLRAMPWINPEE